MAEVGVAFLSGFLQVLFDRLASEEFLSLFRGEQESLQLLEELNIRLISVNKLINDAEEKQLKMKEVARWLDHLKDVIFHADDLVDKIDTEALRRKVEGESSSTTVKVLNEVFDGFHSTVKNEATKILRTLKRLLDQNKNDALGLRERDERKSTSQSRYAPLVAESDVCGRKDDKDKIVELLLSSSDKISVIPIVGMGGIGKTTLAQVAYNDERVKKQFDVRAWVTVTEEFDVFRIIETIFKTVCPDHTGHFKELFELRQKLSEALSGKRFLIVHDDVWNENYLLWDQVKGCFGSGAVGSKIVVTTRHEKVASVMAVGPTHYMAILSSEESWELFVKHAFGGNVDRDLEAIGRKIVSKCGGLPLAVKCLGGLLRSVRDPQEWENICESDIWDDLLKTEANIIPALWLSYRHLPTDLKRCFAYCSMFPKNHEFNVDEMVLWWMAEGFLGMKNDARASKSLEALGGKYFNDLLSRSLFQHRLTWYGKNAVVMHDLVHDLAVIVAGEFGLSIGCTEDVCKLTSKTRHVSHNRKIVEWHKSEGLSKAKHLRTFIGLRLSWEDCPSQLVLFKLLFRNGSSLRVLSLCECPITELTESVGNLIHLRHLDISHTRIKVLPDSVCTLYNLMTLLLRGCRELTMLPKKMENLISLRQLDVEDVPLKGMEMQIKRMKSLIALNQFFVRDGNGMKDFKQIQQIPHGSLVISRIENVVDAAKALEANLKDKKLVTDLKLRWSREAADGASSSEGERNVLDSLRPHTNLRELEIEFYRGTTFPDWVGHSSFTNIVSVSLKNCKNCSSLPPLGQLPSLLGLCIIGFDSVVKIGSEFVGSSPSFRRLRELIIRDMAEVLEWSFGEGVTFPLLREILVKECPKLKISLPSFRCLAFPSLVYLHVDKCKDLEELRNGNEKGQDWPRLIFGNTVSYKR